MSGKGAMTPKPQSVQSKPTKKTGPSTPRFRGVKKTSTSASERDDRMNVAGQSLRKGVGQTGSGNHHLPGDRGRTRPTSGAPKSDISINGKGHVDKKQEEKMTEEENQTIGKINDWLMKLVDQIQKNEFDVNDFKGQARGKGNRTKALIADICTKLKNRKEEMIKEIDTEKEKLDTAIEQLEIEIKTMEKQEKSAKKKKASQKDNVCRINDCTESLKTERKDALFQVKTIYDPLWDWRVKLSEGKKSQLKRKPMNMSGETDIAKVLKEISALQSELLMVKNDEDSEASKNLQKLKKQIRNMSAKVMKENEPPDISAALLTLDNLITEKKDELEMLLQSKQKYKEEVERLHDDVKRFDGIATDNATKRDKRDDEVMQSILLVRQELNEQINKVKENRQQGVSDKKELWSKLHQSVTKLWKTALNEEEKVSSDVRDNIDVGKVLQMIETVTKQFNRLEKVAFKLEETCYDIYEKVCGDKPAKEDQADGKTSISILETTLGKLDKTKTEIVGFADKFEKLLIVLKLNQDEHSISRKCQLMIESIEGFRQKYKEQQKMLDESKEREKIINTEKEDLLHRLSKVASANLTDNNPNIADLSDQNRPTKLAEQFSELYDNPWTDAFEELKHLDDRKRIAFLWDIIAETYTYCKDISINHQKVLMRALQLPTDCMGEAEKTKAKKIADDLKLSPVQSKALSELKKQTVDLSVADVMRYLTTNRKEWFKTQNVRAYASECIKLCWLINVQSPPMYMVTNAKAGSKFDTDQYRPYTKTGKKTDFLVWPVLLLHEGGPLLCKGVAQGK